MRRKSVLCAVAVCAFLLSGCAGRMEISTETKKENKLPPHLVLEESTETASDIRMPSTEMTTDKQTEEAVDHAETETSENVGTNGRSIYTPILNLYYQALYEREYEQENWTPERWYVEEGLVRSLIYTQWRTDNTYFSMDMEGFYFQDLDEDGTDELLLGMREDGFASGEKGYVMAVYCVQNGKPVLAFEGWERNRYIIGNDGYIYNFGSNGAAYGVCTKYRFDKTSEGFLKMSERYYTFEGDGTIEARHITDPEDTEIGFYGEHNGEPVSMDEYTVVRGSWIELGTEIDYTPFSEYQNME